MIPVYKHEIELGLADLIQSTASIQYSSGIAHDLSPTKNKILNKIIEQAKATNENQHDLFYLKSILATTGWNDNSDVFDAEEMWKARHTPEDKPLNIEHDSKQIVGHITSNYAMDDDGGTLDDGLEVNKLPSKYHIVTSGVIYRYFRDKDLMKTVANIIEEIGENKWRVSMEALFANFDYAVTASNKKMEIIPRNDETSFLTKHLGAYGGKGEYNGYKLGRLLRDFTFSGKGLTKTPANPESIIFDNMELFEKSEASLVYTDMTKKENLMSADIETFKAELAKANAEIAKLEKSIKDSDIKAVQATVVTLTADLEKVTKELETSKANLKAESEAKAKFEKDYKDTNDKLTVTVKELTDANTNLAKIELDKITVARNAIVVDKLKYSKEAAEAMVKLFVGKTDEEFNAQLETFAKENKPEVKVEKTAKEIEAEAVAAKKAALESAEASDKKADLNVGGESDKKVESVRAGISNLLKNSRKTSKKESK